MRVIQIHQRLNCIRLPSSFGQLPIVIWDQRTRSQRAERFTSLSPLNLFIISESFNGDFQWLFFPIRWCLSWKSSILSAVREVSWPGIVTINVCNYRFLWADNFLFNVVNQSKDTLKKRGANFYVSLLPLSSLISCENCFTVSLDDFSSFVNNSFSVSVDT